METASTPPRPFTTSSLKLPGRYSNGAREEPENGAKPSIAYEAETSDGPQMGPSRGPQPPLASHQLAQNLRQRRLNTQTFVSRSDGGHQRRRYNRMKRREKSQRDLRVLRGAFTDPDTLNVKIKALVEISHHKVPEILRQALDPERRRMGFLRLPCLPFSSLHFGNPVV